VNNLTRFARDEYDPFALRSHPKLLGHSLRSATEPIDDTSTGKLMKGALAGFAHFDNDVRSDGTYTKQEILQKATQGGLTNRRGQPSAHKPSVCSCATTCTSASSTFRSVAFVISAALLPLPPWLPRAECD